MSQKNIEELMKKGTQLAQEFLQFNAKNFSPYNAVLSAEKLLLESKYIPLNEKDAWILEKGKSYYLKRGYNSSLVAFTLPSQFSPDSSLFKIIGSHTDSPCIRLAPKFETKS